MAKLYFKYGVMNSGKSLFLLSTAHNFEERNIHYLILKSGIDSRDTNIKSRAIQKGKDCIIIKKNDNIVTLYNTIIRDTDHHYKWILVDESQFLSEKQVDQLALLVDTYDINIICYGLRTDFQTHLFPGSKRLMEIADTIEEMKSMCECGNKATVNARIDKEGNIVTEGAQVECGAEDKYITLCRKCFNERINNI